MVRECSPAVVSDWKGDGSLLSSVTLVTNVCPSDEKNKTRNVGGWGGKRERERHVEW